MKFPLESQEAIGEKMMRMVPTGMQSSRLNDIWEIKPLEKHERNKRNQNYSSSGLLIM